MVVQAVTEEMAEHMVNYWTDWRLKTILTDKDNGRSLFKLYKDAVDEVKTDRIVDNIDC